jgi:hypothetical protein
MQVTTTVDTPAIIVHGCHEEWATAAAAAASYQLCRLLSSYEQASAYRSLVWVGCIVVVEHPAGPAPWWRLLAAAECGVRDVCSAHEDARQPTQDRLQYATAARLQG